MIINPMTAPINSLAAPFLVENNATS